MNKATDQSIKRVSLLTKRRVFSLFVGLYESRFKGQGIEHAESREFQMGDSSKDIDWKATAKTSRLFIKQYRETRQLNLCFLVDCSTSMSWKSGLCRSKHDMVLDTIALVAKIAESKGDAFRAILCKGGQVEYVKPGKSVAQTVKILDHVDDALRTAQSSQWTVNMQSLSTVLAKSQPRSICFYLTDMLPTAQDVHLIEMLRKIHAKHELIIVEIVEKVERDPSPFIGLHLKDAMQIPFSLGKNDYAMYVKKVSEQRQWVSELFEKERIDMMSISDTTELYREFVSLSEKRRARYYGRTSR